MTPLTTVPIRPLTRADLAHCLDLAADRGRPRAERAWQLLLTAGLCHGTDGPDADGGGGLIGAYVLTPYGPELASLGAVLVAERHARRGLGRRLIGHALEQAGSAAVLRYATPAERPLFERCGFRAIGASATLQGRFRPGADPKRPSAAPASRRATAADLAAVVRLDADAMGSDRTHLLTRLPAFVEQVRVVEGPRGLAGYAAAWRQGATTVVGPVVADSPALAQRLVHDLLTDTARQSETHGDVRIEVDARHSGLTAWLVASALAPVASHTVMVHGAPDLPGDPERRFAPLMPALG
ncbi:GNAT family N-acetyltransferase [Streptomyces sp. URMC 123]|uniref:GNAT family N-acetyltransferase n=1 Tax=Streptomyces sp. URMC 123 TaxID=3423403 RepID=UPI003F1B1C22